MQKVNEQASQFKVMIDRAFDSDFRKQFQKSIDLAIQPGVDKEEVLKSEEEIDDFFLL